MRYCWKARRQPQPHFSSSLRSHSYPSALKRASKSLWKFCSHPSPRQIIHYCLSMSTKYIISGVLGSFALAYLFDQIVAEKKIFGGTTPSTVANKEWWEATDKKFQSWPRTAGPPVVMNPISRQNFVVKSHES